jgi:hypothetical protein
MYLAQAVNHNVSSSILAKARKQLSYYDVPGPLPYLIELISALTTRLDYPTGESCIMN